MQRAWLDLLCTFPSDCLYTLRFCSSSPFFSRLKSPNSLNLSSSLIISVALYQTLSNRLMSLLYWEFQIWTLCSWCSLISVEEMEKDCLLQPAGSAPPSTTQIPLVFFVAWAHCCHVFNLVSARVHLSFPAEVLSGEVAPSLGW